jgi:LCP family protein required for cell wall assembly
MSQQNPRGAPTLRPMSDDMLLEELLARPPAPGARRVRRSLRRPRRLRLVALVLIGLVLLYLGGRTGLALLTIGRNVVAMRLPTAAARADLAVAAPAATARLAVVPLAPAPATPPATAAPPTSQPAVALRPAGTPAPTASMAATTTALVESLPTLTPVPRQLGVVAGGSPPSLGLPVPGRVPIAEHAPSAGDAITVLLLGIDRRPDEIGPARSDTVIVVRVDPARGRVALLSLPRDLVVDIPGYGRARINAASVYGDLNPQLGGGVELARQTVGNLLGVPIDYVVQVDFAGFVGAIDAIGGIDVDVAQELYDPAYPTMDYGYMVAHFLPGPQHMDGTTALIYSRMRHMDSTYARNQRQQQVIVAALQRLRDQNAFDRVQTVATLSTALRDYIQTDLPLERMVGLAWVFRDLSPGAVERYALDGSMVSEFVDPNDPYATFAAPGAIAALASQLINGPAR